MKKYSFFAVSFFLFCLSFYLYSAFRHFDPDLWGHLKFGEYILNNGIPYKDVFSFVETKPLWVNHEWLSEVIFFYLYSLDTGGFLLLLFKAILCCLTIMLPWFFLYPKLNRPYVLGVIYVIAIIAMSYGTAIRPQIFSYFLFSLTLFLLEKYRLRGIVSYITLPIIFIFWVNTHGAVLAGLVLVCFYALLEFIILLNNKRKSSTQAINLKSIYEVVLNNTFILLPLLLALLLIVNPYGYNYFPYILDAVTMKRPFIDEWQSVFSSTGDFKYFFILCIITILAIVYNIKKLDIQMTGKIILLTALLLLSMLHSRHIPFFVITFAYYLPALFNYNDLLFDKKFAFASRLSKPFNVIASVLLVILGIALVYAAIINNGKTDYNLVVVTKTDYQFIGYPLDTVKFIKMNKLSGKMITNFNWGEFIIFQLYPEIKISVDGRYETVYPDNIMKANMTFINGKPGWQKVLKDFNPDLLLISIYDPVISKMINHQEWQPVFRDVESVLFVKKEDFNL